MTRYKVIVNPVAGRGAGEQAIPRIQSLLGGYGLDFDLVRTERPWHAAELAEQAAVAGFDRVVAVGGDGTANEVLNGLLRARQAGGRPASLGFLSVGRGNDFAYGVGIPKDLEAACRVLAEGQLRTIDVGRAAGGLYPQGRYFGNGVGIGFDAVVGFQAVKLTWLHGLPSYLVAVLETVFLYYRAPLLKIELDGEAFTQRSLLVSVMNGRRMGGGFLMAPHARSNDGLFDLCIAREVSRLRIFGLIPHFMRGTQATQEPIRTGQARRVVVTALDGTLPAHADGETLCTEGQKLELDLLPGQLDVLSTPPALSQQADEGGGA